MKTSSSSSRFNLSKGESCEVPSRMRRVLVGCGWDPDCARSPHAFDLDLACLCLDANGKYVSQENFVYFNNKKYRGDVIVHTGDNLTGDGEGDDERLLIDLTTLPPNVVRIDILCAIYDARNRQQTFGMISNCFLRIVDVTDERDPSERGPLYRRDSMQDAEFCRFAMNDEATFSDGVMFGSLTRDQRTGQWQFLAVQKQIYGGFNGVLEQCRAADDKNEGDLSLVRPTTSSAMNSALARLSDNQPLVLVMQKAKEHKIALVCFGVLYCITSIGLGPMLVVGGLYLCLYLSSRSVQ